jgi:hypothetical protein
VQIIHKGTEVAVTLCKGLRTAVWPWLQAPQQERRQTAGDSKVNKTIRRVSQLVFVAVSVQVGQVLAATLTVCPSGCEYTTIQSAINGAKDNDTISINKGHYFETINSEGKALTLRGINNRQAIIDGDGKGTVVTIPGYKTVLITDLTITRGFGNGGGIVITAAASLNLRHSVVASNYSTTTGGAVQSLASGSGGFNTVTIDDCSVIDNTAALDGGGLEFSSESGGVTITNSTFVRNTAGPQSTGGAILIFGNRVTATIDGSSIVDNTAPYGGGIGIGGDILTPSLIVSNSTIAGNSATVSGGGVRYSFANVTFTNTVLTRNMAAVDGGGLDAVEGGFRGGLVTTTLADTYIVENSATGTGGGILLEGPLTTSGVTVIASNKPNNCVPGSGSGAVCP